MMYRSEDMADAAGAAEPARAPVRSDATARRPRLAAGQAAEQPLRLSADELRALALEAGAEDAGFVSIDRPELDDQRSEILGAFARTRTLVAFVRRMNPDAVRAPARSLSNLEFHHTGDATNETGRAIVDALRARGARAVNVTMGFPMEMDRYPGRIWTVAHKPVAEAAGLGRMGLHRNVIHPRFGNFVLLGTVLTDAVVDEDSRPIDYNPCMDCKLCVAACPVGAISPEGGFQFAACFTHNYREFMGGFTNWVEEVADSRSARDYRARVDDAESASMWQSLSFGANYKAAYCMAVCPAGDDVIEPWRRDRAGFLAETVRPLQDKRESVYVVAGSDAEAHARRRFPHKRIRRVPNALRVTSAAGFLRGVPLVFQAARAGDLAATFHFTFTGAEELEATVRIGAGTVEVLEGHDGRADVHVTTDAAFWVAFLRRERGILAGLFARKLRIRGRAALMRDFARCFAT